MKSKSNCLNVNLIGSKGMVEELMIFAALALAIVGAMYLVFRALLIQEQTIGQDVLKLIAQDIANKIDLVDLSGDQATYPYTFPKGTDCTVWIRNRVVTVRSGAGSRQAYHSARTIELPPIRCMGKILLSNKEGMTRIKGEAWLELVEIYNKYKEYIENAIDEEELTEELDREKAIAVIVAIIKKESNGDPYAESVDSYGLMQIYLPHAPVTCEGIVDPSKDIKEELSDPEKNIQCGVRIFKNKIIAVKDCAEPYDNGIENLIKLGLAAYNGGQAPICDAIEIVGSSRWEDIDLDTLTEACRPYYDNPRWKAEVIMDYVTKTFQYHLEILDYIESGITELIEIAKEALNYPYCLGAGEWDVTLPPPTAPCPDPISGYTCEIKEKCPTDCGAYTKWVFNRYAYLNGLDQIIDVRTAKWQGENVGEVVDGHPACDSCNPISPDLDSLRPGDLVFFCGTYDANGNGVISCEDDGVTHVGIYVGSGRMIEAAILGVTIDYLSGNYVGARRVLT